MSTAGRPTWHAAIGRDIAGSRKIKSKQIAARDLKSHSKLKTRQTGQNSLNEVKNRDLKQELEDREKKHLESKKTKKFDEDDVMALEPIKEEEEPVKEKSIDADDSDDDSSSSSSSDDDKDDDEDDTAELMRELERIKKEREEEAARKQMQEIARDVEQREEQMLYGNPLLNETQDHSIKKRWYDDTVFKNQTKGEVKKQKRFINDTIRNDFHRKFLQKYIK